MPDLERLQADAQEAEIRGEMARSHLTAAKESARERSARWAKSHSRGLEASRSTGASRRAQDATE